jgi:uncharacterized phage protein (TIGR01671 family)
MREIKFRTWDKERGYFCSRFLYLRQDGKIMWWGAEKGFEDATDIFDIQFFTNLNDKNGVEIYEGDVCRWASGRYKGEGRVVFEKGGFNIDGFYDPSQDYPVMAFSENAICEVIGNIYENPELLEEGNK